MIKKQLILIVDDTPENLRVLGDMLENQGYELLVATNGGDALENAMAFPHPDLILLDVMMPDMDGYEVCRRLKANPELAAIPVIFISALGLTDEKLHAFRDGAVDYITKPFQVEEVLARVGTHLQLVRIEELSREVEERRKAEMRLERTLGEKETLIQELYHRTKNTMQVIRSLLLLQADHHQENADLQKLVANTNDRIQAMSLVHQMLYQSNDLSQLSIREYIEKLIGLIMNDPEKCNSRVRISTEIEEGYFLLDTAIPFGLIFNELLTNSLKHAFPGTRTGEIRIFLKKEGADTILFDYSDNGVGVPPGFDFESQKSLGLVLIHSLGSLQMQGKVTMKNEEGIKCVLVFPAAIYRRRI